MLLEGHADTIGGDQYNQDLSERRAQAVRRWLVDQAHLSPLQIDTVGYGNARPLVPSSKSPAAQQANRRVEVLVAAVTASSAGAAPRHRQGGEAFSSTGTSSTNSSVTPLQGHHSRW